MPIVKQKIIIDTNVWISFAIGKHLKHLINLLNNQLFEIYICDEIITEINDVIKRPKLRKYLNLAQVTELKEIIALTTIKGNHFSKITISRDLKDNYLLALAKDINANYIITGDSDLLVLNQFENTIILTFNNFSILYKL